MSKDIDVNLVLAAMREAIGNQAQEIALLKATITSLENASDVKP